MVSTPRSTQGPGNSYSRKYRSIAVGGTFDQIHKGHRALLSRAFDNGQQVFIGLTSDELAKKMGKNIRNDFAKANEKRRTLGLPDMKIEIVPLVLASDGRRISSTRIRAGEIDSEGRFLRNKEE